MIFDPCTTSPGNCPQAEDAQTVRFHKWERAFSFANGRAKGQQNRYRVFYDGRHWRTRNLVTRHDV